MSSWNLFVFFLLNEIKINHKLNISLFGTREVINDALYELILLKPERFFIRFTLFAITIYQLLLILLQVYIFKRRFHLNSLNKLIRSFILGFVLFYIPNHDVIIVKFWRLEKFLKTNSESICVEELVQKIIIGSLFIKELHISMQIVLIWENSLESSFS